MLKDIGRKCVSISNLGLSLCVRGKNIYVERRDKLFLSARMDKCLSGNPN